MWMECSCLRTSHDVRVRLIGTATHAALGQLRECVEAADVVDPLAPLVVDVRDLAHVCPGVLWELDRMLDDLRERRPVRLTGGPLVDRAHRPVYAPPTVDAFDQPTQPCPVAPGAAHERAA